MANRIRGGGRAITVGADVSAEVDVARLFAETAAAFGRIDILVANSGAQKNAAIADMTLADWKLCWTSTLPASPCAAARRSGTSARSQRAGRGRRESSPFPAAVLPPSPAPGR